MVKAKHAGTPPADSEKHFTVTACVISMADFAEARDMVMALKNKYWIDGLYSYKGIQKRVCFHSREIRGRKDAFNPDIIDYKSFVADLSQLMAAIPMCICDRWADTSDRQPVRFPPAHSRTYPGNRLLPNGF